MKKNNTGQRETLLNITPEEAAKLVESFAWHFMDDGDEIARFLLVVNLLTYTRDITDRENYHTAITNVCAPYLNGHDEMIKGEMTRALDGLRGKGTQKGGAR